MEEKQRLEVSGGFYGDAINQKAGTKQLVRFRESVCLNEMNVTITSFIFFSYRRLFFCGSLFVYTLCERMVS